MVCLQIDISITINRNARYVIQAGCDRSDERNAFGQGHLDDSSKSSRVQVARAINRDQGVLKSTNAYVRSTVVSVHQAFFNDRTSRDINIPGTVHCNALHPAELRPTVDNSLRVTSCDRQFHQDAAIAAISNLNISGSVHGNAIGRRQSSVDSAFREAAIRKRFFQYLVIGSVSYVNRTATVDSNLCRVAIKTR